MKKNVFTLLCLLFLSISFTQAQNAGLATGPKAKWTKTVHDFGKIKQGVPVSTTFGFKSVGSAPVIISEVQASCGCTSPNWTKEAILPNKTGKVSAKYNAKNIGTFNKTVTVITNGNGKYVLTIRGEVVK